MAPPPRDCPCHSGLRYVACCARLHRGEQPAATPEALMRSRFAAFALGLGEYLVETLAEEHPDRGHPREELIRSLSRARERQRFLDSAHPRDVHRGGPRRGALPCARLRARRGSFLRRAFFVPTRGRWLALCERGTRVGRSSPWGRRHARQADLPRPRAREPRAVVARSRVARGQSPASTQPLPAVKVAVRVLPLKLAVTVFAV